MTFSFYQSLRSIPQYLQEAAAVYQFDWLKKATKLEIPFFGHGIDLEQHDEHGGRLVLPDRHRSLSIKGERISDFPV